MTYKNLSQIFDAIQAGDASFIDLLDFVGVREMEAWERGFGQAMKTAAVITGEDSLKAYPAFPKAA